ncbi:hypothetical protein ACFFX0_32825 [Citricoccus parietis]|uniref:DUF4158 domain-containing protein n=1 Tax=Citricoccus parietis TaxID=592307 RepID=A0ABV5G8F7_9MICC
MADRSIGGFGDDLERYARRSRAVGDRPLELILCAVALQRRSQIGSPIDPYARQLCRSVQCLGERRPSGRDRVAVIHGLRIPGAPHAPWRRRRGSTPWLLPTSIRWCSYQRLGTDSGLHGVRRTPDAHPARHERVQVTFADRLGLEAGQVLRVQQWIADSRASPLSPLRSTVTALRTQSRSCVVGERQRLG